MKLIIRYTDQEILRAVDVLRKSHDGQYGPVSLDQICTELETTYGGPRLSKSNLAPRITRLVQNGCLTAYSTEKGLIQPWSLSLTEVGRKLMEAGNGE